MRKRVLLSLAINVTACLFLSYPPQVQASSWEEMVQKLYAAAKSEGEVVFSAGAAEMDLGGKEGIAKFSKRFPGIKVTVINLSSSKLVPRLIVEARAGRSTVDLYTDDPTAVRAMMERGVVVVVNPSEVTDKPRLVWNQLLAANHTATNFAYNTRLVAKKSDLPRRYEDLLDPKWKGKLALDARGGNTFTHLPLVWDQDRFWNFIKALPEQKPVWARNNRDATDKVVRGEAAIGNASFTGLQALKFSGAPIEFLPLNPVSVRVKVFAPVKNASHPNAAKLLIAWLLSPEGIEAGDKVGAGPAIPGTNFYKELVESGAELYYDEKLTIEQMVTYEKTYEQIGETWGVLK